MTGARYNGEELSPGSGFFIIVTGPRYNSQELDRCTCVVLHFESSLLFVFVCACLNLFVSSALSVFSAVLHLLADIAAYLFPVSLSARRLVGQRVALTR